MSTPEDRDLTELLAAFSRGDENAARQLLPLVYDELHAIARRRRWQWSGSSGPGTTSLVHEAYINLANRSAGLWENRAHFFYVASVAMRNILIDAAKRQSRARHGGGKRRASIQEVAVPPDRSDELLSLDDALGRLEQADSRLGRIVECRFFGGLTIDETAQALSLSPATVKRGWETARSWLYKELAGRAKGASLPEAPSGD